MTPVNDLMQRVAGADPVRVPARSPPTSSATPTRSSSGCSRRLRPGRAAPRTNAPALAAARGCDRVCGPGGVRRCQPARLRRRPGPERGREGGRRAHRTTTCLPRRSGRHGPSAGLARGGTAGSVLRDLAHARRPDATAGSGRCARKKGGIRRGRRPAPPRAPGRALAPLRPALSNLIYETGFGRDRSAKGAPGLDPFDPGRSLKELQAEGKLRVAGRVDVDGRPAYRLVSGDVRASDGTIQRSVLLVDAETYLPRELRLVVRAQERPAAERPLALRGLRAPAPEQADGVAPPPPRAARREVLALRADEIDRKGSLGFPNPCAR